MFFIYEPGTGKIVRASLNPLSVTKPGYALGEKTPPAEFTMAKMGDYIYTRYGVVTPAQFAARQKAAAATKAPVAAKAAAPAVAKAPAIATT